MHLAPIQLELVPVQSVLASPSSFEHESVLTSTQRNMSDLSRLRMDDGSIGVSSLQESDILRTDVSGDVRADDTHLHPIGPFSEEEDLLTRSELIYDRVCGAGPFPNVQFIRGHGQRAPMVPRTWIVREPA